MSFAVDVKEYEELVAEAERLREELQHLNECQEGTASANAEYQLEIDRLRTALSRANVGMEQAERGLYLQLEKAESEIERLRAELEGFTHEAPGVAVYRLAGDKLERENVSELLAEFERLRTERDVYVNELKLAAAELDWFRRLLPLVQAVEDADEGYPEADAVCVMAHWMRDNPKPRSGT